MFFCHFNGLPSCMNIEQSFIVPLVKPKRIVFAANNSRCCECYVAPTITLCFGLVAPTIILCFGLVAPTITLCFGLVAPTITLCFGLVAPTIILCGMFRCTKLSER
jgi:hypothetical protein